MAKVGQALTDKASRENINIHLNNPYPKTFRPLYVHAH